MKKPKLIPLAILTAIFFLGFHWYANVEGADWKYLGKDATGITYYYDAGTVSYSSTGIVKVWIKSDFSESDRDFWRRKEKRELLDFDPKDLDYSIRLQEISCRDRQIRTLSATDYDKNGNVLKSYNFKEHSMATWNDIIPDSFAEEYIKTLCHK